MNHGPTSGAEAERWDRIQAEMRASLRKTGPQRRGRHRHPEERLLGDERRGDLGDCLPRCPGAALAGGSRVFLGGGDLVIDAPARVATEREASAARDPIEWNDRRVWETRVERTEVAVEFLPARMPVCLRLDG